jgi:uncharacterized membrane protein required for colicin V production
MMKRKGFLQSVSQIFGVVSFILALVCAGFLYVRMGEFGGNNPISASLMASIFFFICVGVILTVIGRSNLPSFKIDV